MKHNVGSTDKIVRLVLAVVLFALIFVLPGNARWIGLIGVVPLFTALFGTCPLYSMLGINTCGISTKP